MNFSFGEHDDWYKCNPANKYHSFSNGNVLHKASIQKRLKRRSSSPKVFPNKIRVTENKVVADLLQLQISSSKGQKSPRSFLEIENSLVLDSDTDEDETGNLRIHIADKFQNEINEFKRSLFQRPSPSTSTAPTSNSRALVLWSPPKPIIQPPPPTSPTITATPSDHSDAQPLSNCPSPVPSIAASSRDLEPFTNTSPSSHPTFCDGQYDYDEEMEL